MEKVFLLLVLFPLLAVTGCAPLTNAQKAHSLLKYGYYDKAIALYDEAIKSDNLSPIALEEAYFNRGYAKYEKYYDDGAIADYSKAIEINPKNKLAYAYRARIKEEKNDSDGSIADLSKAIELDSKYAYAYNARGIIKKHKKDLDGAIADFNKAIEIDPKYSDAYFNRGLVKGDKLDYDDAINDFNKGIDLDPEDWTGFIGRGFTFLYANKPDKAIADFETSFKIHPSHYGSLWLFLAKEKNNRDGGTELKKYKEENIKDTKWPFPAIQLYLGEITPEDCLAASAHEIVLKEKMQKCEAYCFIGEFYLLHGDAKKAKEYLQKSVDVGYGTIKYTAHGLSLYDLQKLHRK